MADISSFLKKILEAIYGEEVRGSIHDALAAMNKESSSAMEFAATAKDSAKASAEKAKNEADTARQKAAEALDSAGKAAQSETNAKASETAAEGYADLAVDAAERAGASEKNAKASEQTALQQAREAEESKNAAALSEAEAKAAEERAKEVRNQVAKMKQIPVSELIQGKKLLFVDDSIVRGTQLRETTEFLYQSGAKEVHIRPACPPLLFGCKYLNFSRGNSDMELLARRVIQELEGDEGHKHLDEYSDSSTERGQCLLKSICEKFGFDSLGYQSLDGVLEAIGIDRDKVCTYCWNGKE